MSSTNFHTLPIWSHFQHFDMKARCILLGECGSRSYGTNVDDSDRDFLGAFMPTDTMLFGLEHMEQWRLESFKINQGEVWDGTIYEIRKLFHLWLKNNPHTLQLLALPDHCYWHISPEGKEILANKHLFFSKRLYGSFIGFAHSQVNLMKRQASGIGETGRLGAKRKELIERVGFDAKAAGHLIRLLRTGYEMLATGQLNVFRTDASQLKEIRSGAWPLEKVEAEANRLFQLCETALATSQLPNEPDYHGAELLLTRLVKNYIVRQ